ncbi:MAG: MBL fold metallo-hydrolase, partial [bacterium]
MKQDPKLESDGNQQECKGCWGKLSHSGGTQAARAGLLLLFLLLTIGSLNAQPETRGLVKLTDRVWAWIAKNDRSCNSALFVGEEAALVVDPGLTPAVAREFLAAVRKATDKPIRWAILTHWHPDHSFGAICLGTRQFQLVAHPRTRRALAENAAQVRKQLVAAAENETERQELESCEFKLPEKIVAEREPFDLGALQVQLFHPGAAHTQGDLVVWSPQERVLVTGDLFLHDSAPSMGEGSVLVWIEALERLAALEPQHVLPGHFAPGGVADMLRFRSYLQAQVEHARSALANGQTMAEAVKSAAFPRFAAFLQYPQYDATFEANARDVLRELQAQPPQPGEADGFRVRKILDVGKAPHQISFSADGRTAYVAAAGSNQIAVVDVASLTVARTLAVDHTPLGVVELPGSAQLAVSQFQSDRLQRLSLQGTDEIHSLVTGAGPSLFAGPLPENRFLISAERANRLWLLDARDFTLVRDYPTGNRPFPPAATSDGRKAFVPNYVDGTVTVVDLWNQRVLATVPVGTHPSGGAVLPGDIEYAVAVRGDNRVVFINTASLQVVDSLSAGIGDGPFSVVVSPDGQQAFVNNTASNDISVIERHNRRVIARIPVGKTPITLSVHPSGTTLWSGCEGSNQLYVIDLPQSQKTTNESQKKTEGDSVTEVLVLGTIHGQHRTSKKWGLQQVAETIRRIAPDVICPEIPPDRWQRVWRDWAERGVIEDPRVQRFPEYTDVLLPLKIQMGFEVEPCAAWTKEMSDLRQARIKQFESDPAFAAKNEQYQKAVQEVNKRLAANPIEEDDPYVIHSERYDQRTKEELAPYDRFLNDWIGPGGWTHINEAHYRLVDRAIKRHRGKRILITFGAGHKYWFLERLRQRTDIKLLDVTPFLPP